MAQIRLKLDLSGTRGDERWQRLRHFSEVQEALYPSDGSGPCPHAIDQPHPKGEWRSAIIRLSTPLLAQYAVSHYLEQEGVLDVDVEE
jgi:hypothetical protein